MILSMEFWSSVLASADGKLDGRGLEGGVGEGIRRCRAVFVHIVVSDRQNI